MASAAPVEFLELAARLRELQEAFSGSAPSREAISEAAALISEATAWLQKWPADEAGQFSGSFREIPGRGQVLGPPYVIDESDGVSMRGRVTFGRYYLGRNGAVHGGALALFWEALLGSVGSRVRPGRAAYLHAYYRAVTPIDRELTFEVRLVREEGRKLFIAGRLFDGEILCTEAESLVLTLLPGQP